MKGEITMKSEIKIYKEGLGEYPKKVQLQVFFMILWIALVTIACWLTYTLIAWLYLDFEIIMVFIVL